jgi:hypothetical protein
MARSVVFPLEFRATGLWGALALAILVGACGSRDRPDHDEGLTVVRSVGVGRWGTATTLDVELEMGALEGPPEFAFGRIAQLAVDADGAMYVYDALVPALRKYSRDGEYQYTLAAEGSGPGEYKRIEGLEICPNGMIAAWDVGNARINLYLPTGAASSSIRVPGSLQTSRPFAVDTSGLFYVKVNYYDARGALTPRLGFMRLTLDGTVVDTLPEPQEPPAPSYAIPITFSQGGLDNFPVAKKWAVGPQGHMVVGVNDEYTFDIVSPEGPSTRVYRDRPAARLAPEERAEWKMLIRGAKRVMPPVRGDTFLPPVPEVKPPYRELYMGSDGRIWVHLYVGAEKVGTQTSDPELPTITWYEPAVFDVFEFDGAYLGEVRFPMRYWPMVMKGDTVWGVRRGEFNEQYVFRMRLEHDEH